MIEWQKGKQNDERKKERKKDIKKNYICILSDVRSVDNGRISYDVQLAGPYFSLTWESPNTV